MYREMSSIAKLYKTLAFVFALMSICALAIICASTQPAYAKEKSNIVKIKVSALGDCALYNEPSGSSRFNDYFNAYGPSYFFSNIDRYFKNDDVTLFNLENVFTDATKRKKKTYNFKGPASYVNIMKSASIEIVNLANNHTMDFLRRGLKDTQNVLKSNGFSYCFKKTIAYKTVKGIKMAFLGFNNVEIEKFTKKQIKSGIDRAKKNGAKIIVVSMHWGGEFRYMPNSIQRKFGRYAIDCGASLVVGNHSHVVQGIEKYKNRYIVYSLGNLLFGGNSNFYDKDTMIFQQTFTVKDGELTDKLNARVIPCNSSGNLSINDCRPCVPEDPKLKKQVMSKIRTVCRYTHTTVTYSGKIK